MKQRTFVLSGENEAGELSLETWRRHRGFRREKYSGKVKRKEFSDSNESSIENLNDRAISWFMVKKVGWDMTCCRWIRSCKCYCNQTRILPVFKVKKTLPKL